MVLNASGHLSTAFLCLTLLFDDIPLHVRRAIPKAQIMQTSLMSVQKTKSPCIPSALFQQNPVAASYGKYSDPSSPSPGTFSWFPSGFTATFSATALIDASYVKSFEELRARDRRFDVEPLLPPWHTSWWCESNGPKPVVGRILHCRLLPQPKKAVDGK